MLNHYKIQIYIERMRSSNYLTRMKAMEALHRIDLETITTTLLQIIIKAAARKYDEGEDEWDDPSFCLMSYAARFHDESVVPLLLKNFDRFSPRAQSLAIRMLQRFDAATSVPMILPLIEQYADHLTIDFEQYVSDEVAAPLLFPRLLPLLFHERHYQQLMLVFSVAAKNGTIDGTMIERMTSELNDFVHERYEQIKPYWDDYSRDFVWRAWKVNYLGYRFELGIALDLLGFLPTANREFLEKLRHCPDYFVRLFALTSLQRHGIDSPKAEWEQIASDDETRYICYDELRLLHQVALYPESFYNRVDFARCFLTNFVKNDEDFGSLPEAIEHIATHTVEERDFESFRFRRSADEPWLIAAVGPYSHNMALHERAERPFYTMYAEEGEAPLDEQVERIAAGTLLLNHNASEDDYFSWHPAQANFPYVLTLYSFLQSYYSTTLLQLMPLFWFSVALFAFGIVSIYTFTKRRKTILLQLSSDAFHIWRRDSHTRIAWSDVAKIERRRLSWLKGDYIGYFSLATTYLVFVDRDGNELGMVPEVYCDMALLQQECMKHQIDL